MKPTDTKISEQDILLKQNNFGVLIDELLTNGDMTDEDTIYNKIEVLTDEVEFERIQKYNPATKAFALEDSMKDLNCGAYTGYFKDISVKTGRVRLISW